MKNQENYKSLICKRAVIIVCTLFMMLCSVKNIYASNYYWVGGTGNWSDYGNHWATASGGVIFHTTIPGPTDNVHFDANSFLAANDTVYLDSTLVYCKNMNWTGVSNNPVIKNQTGINSKIKLYGSLNLVAGMNYSGININFESSSAGNSILTGGQHLGNIIFNGNGDWTLGDSLNAGYIYFNNGSLTTNNRSINCAGIACYGVNPINLQLGTSVINISNSWDMTSSTNLTLGSSAARIICQQFKSGANQLYDEVSANSLEIDSTTINKVTYSYDINSFYMNHMNVDNSTIQQTTVNGTGLIFCYSTVFQKIVFTDNGTVSGYSIFDTLIFSKSGSLINLGGTLTINDLFSAPGSCSGLANIQGPATINKTSGTVVLDYALLKDINATGGAVFIANNSIDNGNVTGWTINSPSGQNLYWVGGTGNWSDLNHWAINSGGAGGSCIPNPFDSIYFDVNSFPTSNDTVYIDEAFIYCKNMNWTGVANNPVIKNQTGINSKIKLYGSLNLVAGMNYSGININFESSSAGNSILTGGQHLGNIIFNGNGDWTLGDSLNAGYIYFNNGSLTTNNRSINCAGIACYGVNPINLQLGTSVINISNSWDMTSSTNLTLGSSAARIICQQFKSGANQLYNEVSANSLEIDSTTINKVTYSYDINSFYMNHMNVDNSTIQQTTVNGTGLIFCYSTVFQKIVFTDNGTVSGYSIFDTLIFTKSGSLINLGGTLTINDLFSAPGSCSGLANIQGPATINKTSGTVVLDYALLKDINATGGAVFIANNSIDNGNVTGWTINSPSGQNLYWVGGTGNWSDLNHWAINSGGAGGSCIPNPFDSIYFDVNSFPTSNDTVYIDEAFIYCKNMNWTGVSNNPVIKNQTGINSKIKLYGSLNLVAGMNYSGININFESSSAGNSILTGGQHLGNIIFNGNGDWTLGDSLNAGYIYFNNGSLTTNNRSINCAGIACYGVNPINLQLGTSVINISNSWDMTSSTNLTLGSSAARIICQQFKSGANQLYDEVSANSLEIDSTTINKVTYSYDINSFYMNHMNVDNSTIQQTTVYGTGYMYCNNSVFQRVVFTDNGNLSGYSIFDTLIFSQPGSSINFGGSLTINKALWINSSPGFPNSVQGTATINSSAPNIICLDYLYLQNINTSGGASFFAGDHSIDLGNNTGWLWSSCTPDTSNVWPGDANYDLIADNIDLLYIGLAYGYTGPARAGASINWVAQPGIDWLQQFATGYNIKHADCDGNGIVNAVDTNAVVLNYGLVHPFKQQFPPSPNNFGTDLYFDLPTGALSPGATVDIPIMFGTQSNPADNFYGIAFTINYDPALIQSNTMELTFDSTWFGNISNTLHLNKDFYNNGAIDMAFVKTDHQNEAGYGNFATLHFKLANVTGATLNLSFSKILVLDKFEITQPVNVINGSVFTGIENNSSQPGFNVYPNPANDQVRIDNHLHTIEMVRIIDITGKIVSEINKPNNQIIIDVQPFKNGIYFIEVTSGKGIMRQKISIMH